MIECRLSAEGADLTVSVVIPTKNAGEEFRRTLEAIQGQKSVAAELVTVDSGSSDGTVELARRYGARTISIPPESFNHGETRNLGVREANGDLCVMLVQDAVPADDHWLANLLAPFSDERVVGVTGRQIARADADPMGRWDVEWGDRFLGDQIAVREVRDWKDFLSWDYEQRLRTVWFNNVCSALRRQYWEKHPFRAVRFAEDVDWSVRALASGYRIVYNPTACVVHSHTRSAAHRLKRQYLADKVTRRLLQAAPVDPIVRNDTEFLTVISLLCGEVQAELPQEVWPPDTKPDPGRDHARWQRYWGFILAALGVRSGRPYWKLTAVRQSFHEICEQLWAVAPCLEPAARGEVLLQALAQTVAVFAASYHSWCEANSRLSIGMQRLDRALSEGV